MTPRRVVITGLGPVTPIGIGVEEYWNALLSGRSGVSRVTTFDTEKHATKIAAVIRDWDVSPWVSRKEARRMDRFCEFAIAAAALAVEDAGLESGTYPDEEVGVIIGSGIGGVGTIETQHDVIREKGADKVTPFLIPMIVVNMASGMVSMRFGFRGPNSAVATACATGSHAIGDALSIIRRGEATAMLAGGAEAPITPLAMAGFSTMKAMSTRNDEPEKASRPFDRERDGFVMGEGAGVMVLEEYEAARKRGARIYGEITGYGMSGDAYHITAPDPEGRGISRAMSIAIGQSGLALEDYGYINPHGTSTPLNDKLETMAIKKVFGDHAEKIAISSTKSMTGHLIGAAGGVEAIVCALVLSRGAIPPTINQEFSDPECDLDYVPNEAREAKVRAAVSNSLGFGGHNAVITMAAV